MDKKILVTRSSMPPLDEYVDEIRSMWETHWLTNMGEKHKALQAELKKVLGVENVELLTNGHMALELSLQAMHLSGEVITTPFTFASTTHAIVRNGLRPVFCDIRPDDFTMDAQRIEALITPRTCAILPVHVYGNLCDTDAIEDIAKRHHLKVLYDAAHAFGVTKNGKSAASFGDASCFSFHATKVFNTIEGGAVIYKDPEFGPDLYRLKNFGIRDEVTVDGVGANAKMNEFCAAMGLCNLRHLGEEIDKRRTAVERYDSHLRGVPGIQLNPQQEGVTPNYAYYPVIFDPDVFGASRDDVAQALRNENIFPRKYFYPITSTFDCYKGKFDINETPVALRTSLRVLTLPLYADLALEDVDRICGIVLNCGKH